MQQKYATLPPRTKFEGWDYHKNQRLRMTGREWHEYAKTDRFKISSDRDNRDATMRGYEIWDVK